MASRSEHDPPRRVSLALPDGPLRRKILNVLEGAEVEVELLEESGALEASIQPDSGHSGVIVVHTDDLDEAQIDALVEAGEDHRLAVIGEDDPGRRARLIAAGASHVLSGGDRALELGEALETLAEQKSGAARGPEIRGSEARPSLADFLTRSPRMRAFVDIVRRVVHVDTSLLITGPTGVGKERLARAIHADGPRRDQPFVAVNCGALPESLLESELFGHEKGAFTGADRARKGQFEIASGGIIFLDEIGEMPIHLQVKLLTVLQRHEVTPLGGQRPIGVDVRVVAATNRDLQAEVERGEFREDLFYRLNVLPLAIPALATRPDDIADLAGRFIAHFRDTLPESHVESISDEAVDALMRYSWPGNIRELINVIERAMVLGRDRSIGLLDLPPAIRGGSASPPDSGASAGKQPLDYGDRTLKDVREGAIRDAEIAFLAALLRESNGQIAVTAKRAGISSRALYERMKRYGLRKEDFKDG